MDTPEEQYVFQNFYYKFKGTNSNGEYSWAKQILDKKHILWKNSVNGLAIAALKDINWEIKLPNALPTYKVKSLLVAYS